MQRLGTSLCLMLIILGSRACLAQGQSAEELAKKLSNPIASLVSVPLQFNYDDRIGPLNDGDRYTLNIQPVIPTSIGNDWNLISRTILPIVSQQDIFPGAGTQTGLGDVLQSLFFSPKQPTESGLIWGVGPALLIPTATDDLLGAGQWAAGPTAVLLKQSRGWTYGALFNHLWSFAGDGNRSPVSSTFLQPFVSYTTPTAWTYSLNTESTYDWHSHHWTVPVNLALSKLTRVGGQAVSLGGGVRYYARKPADGPDWGLRMTLTFLFPK